MKATPEAVVSQRPAALQARFSGGARGLDQPFKGNLGRLLFDSQFMITGWAIRRL
jgi:hypothetical protein